MRKPPRRLLLATDFSDLSQTTVPYAIGLARALKARLIACHALDASTPSVYDAAILVLPARAKELATEAEKRMHALFDGAGIEWEAVLLEGDAALAVSDTADDKDVDLIIAGTHGRSGLSRALLGSTTERLLRTATRPVLTLRAPASGSEPEPAPAMPPRRILVGCDFSPDSQLALEHALAYARELRSEVHLLHAIEPTLYGHIDASTGALAADLERAVESAVRSRLERLAPPETRQWCQIKTVFASGYPYEEITRHAASHEVDLIVLGLRGHSLLDRMLLGSTADRVIRKAHCPVLAVQEPDRGKK